LVLITGGWPLIAVGSVQQGSVGSQKSQSNIPTRHAWRGTREPVVKQGRMGEAWRGQHEQGVITVCPEVDMHSWIDG
jgi:hypothetical protein